MPNRIRELRSNLNLTQAELAKKIGLNQSAVGKYEREELEPNLDTLMKLSAIFECSIDYIIGYSDDFGNVTVNNDSSAPSLSPDEWQLVKDYRELAPALREMLQATIQTWKGTTANSQTKPHRA